MAETEQPIKRPRGNPQFQINKKLKEERLKKEQNKNTMADEKETTKEVDEKGNDVKDETPKAQSNGTSTDAPAPDTLPDDLFSDKMPGEEVLPLDGQVKEKPYAALPGDAAESTPSTGTEKSSSESSSTPSPDAKPAEKPLTPEEIQSQASQTADLLLKGYDKLHALGRWIGKVDESDLAQMHAKGKINLEQVLPLGKKSITVHGFFQEYNQGIDQNIVVEQEFKDKIKPPLVRECVRRGWLLSDMNYILVMTAEDLSTKIGMLVGLKKSANLVLNACQEMMKAQREQGQTKKSPPQQQTEHQQENTETVEVDWHEPSEEGTPQP